ncbi:MAG: ribonuclease P protein component [Phycisphaerales bacterium]|nr:ribonuclease P protein component [Phycisphaerales bacterium]
MEGPPRQLVFRRRHRLSKASEFDAVFAHKIRKSRGPITLHLRPNDLPHHRLGLSIGRRVGNAVTRSRLKRMIREVFRLHHATMPMLGEAGYDLVISARKHDPMTLDAYRAAIIDAMMDAHAVQVRRDG